MSLLSQQGLSGLLGAGLGQGGAGCAQQQAAAFGAQQNYNDYLTNLVREASLNRNPTFSFAKKDPETLREELQLETDEWLKDTV